MATFIYNADSSSPSIDLAYKRYHWDQDFSWDLTTIDSIPNGARVNAVKLNWKLSNSNGKNIANTHVALFNENGLGEWMIPGFFSYCFMEVPVKQVWFTNYQVTEQNSLGFIMPVLTIDWYDPSSLMSGTIEVRTSNERNVLEEKVHKNNNIIERTKHPLKINNSHPIHNTSSNFYNLLTEKMEGKNNVHEPVEQVDEFIKSNSSIILEAEPIELVNKSDNSMLIQRGVSYALGSINGKPLHAMLMEGGGITNNFSPMIFKKPNTSGSPITPEQLKSLEIKLSYSMEEHKEAQHRISVLGALANVAEDKSSIEIFNQFQYSEQFKDFAENIGLDLTKAFMLNGKKFMFSNGELSKA